ncbi:alpha-L-rhamnosidase [Flavobacterium cheongpyeongense]|uniref:alpha-L-rhamnosidase n=1 Tax=Flavobacterium cheongpyeongense TaxID=2212651 RepID=A0A2V4BKH9_9FLAO|nr:family 78 glycoside hydrolase catalytic domain [Flavobacterium cheongpyeongense]PXY39311.1 alpha-L-rhamnosidase [Flavobacterium cheongpyeongense]
MNQIKTLLLFVAIFSSSLYPQQKENKALLSDANIQISNLKVENAVTPIGLDVSQPVFSWQMQNSGSNIGCYQTAYQIIVTNHVGQEVWNTGKVNSGTSINIKYKGENFKSATLYNWTVNVWNQKGKKYAAHSWFETGLMNPKMVTNSDLDKSTAWSGAKWIGGNPNDMVLYSQYLPVFCINSTIHLDEKSKSTKASLVYGANDLRLMDRNKNQYKLENKKDESYIEIELNLGRLNSDQNAKLNIYRVGYDPNDKKDLSFKSFSISNTILNKGNRYNPHTISVQSCLGVTKIYIDGNSKENLVADVNLNPLGAGGDFIAFPVVGDIGFLVRKGEKAQFSNIEIKNYRSPSNVIFSENGHTPSIFSAHKEISIKDNSYTVTGGNNGFFVLANPSQHSMPMLRTVFEIDSTKISKARLYVTARGIYDIYLNGKKVGNDYFNPGLTQYNKTHLYQTYDVTSCIQNGNNALGAVLGEGWWSGGSTFVGENWNFFGDRQSMLAKLVVTYSDGSEKITTSSPETWQYFNDGPVKYSSFFQGEVYDAGKEKAIEGWDTAQYDASNWHQAVAVETNGFVSLEGTANLPNFNNFSDAQLVGQFGNTVQPIKELTAQSVKEVRPGVFVYDMGQNMVGVPKITMNNVEKGKKIVLRYAEVLYPDLPEYKGNENLLMLENVRAAMSQDIYITKGGSETINPRFTFHGYRYVAISGIDKPLQLDHVKGTVLSSVHELSSHYQTSNPLVNKLWENITWSMYGNFLSIPTDCPQRNERLGWSGDISVFSRTAVHLADVEQFLRRHMLAMRDIQTKEGRFPDVAPIGVGFGETLWGSAGITVAWENYLQYGDLSLLEEHYDAMKSYANYLIDDIDNQTGVLKEKERNTWSSLGDWLSLEDSKNEKTLFWEAYFIYDLEIMIKVAALMDKKEDELHFSEYYKKRKDFFNMTYIDAATGKTSFRGKIVDTQTSYALPFAFNIFNKKNSDLAIKQFIASMKRENKTDQGVVCPPYSLMTGFIGTAWVNKALSDNGYSNVAYQLLQQTSYPSWLYPVSQGATTIWERLNSYTHKDGFGGNNRMNSFNHYAFGAVGAWMYNYSLGIVRDDNSPGFKHFVLQPEPDSTGKMTFANGYYDSMYGRIESSWEKKNGKYEFRFVVPANTSATLYLPALKENDVTVTGKKSGIKFLNIKNNKAVFQIESGEYSFETVVRN